MALVLIIAGAVWFSLSLIFVLALVSAARRGIPAEVQPVAELVTSAEEADQSEFPVVDPQDPKVIAEIDESISVSTGVALASMPSPIGAPD